MTEKSTINDNQVEEMLERGLDEWDAARDDGLRDLFIFFRAKAESDALEATRLARKHGAGHPFVAEALANLAAHRHAAAETRRAIVRARTVAPPANPEAWTIYGYVYDAREELLANAAVLFFDARDASLLRAPRAKTNADGFFRLEVGEVERLPAAVAIGVSTDRPGETIFEPAKGAVDYAEIFAAGDIKPPTPDDTVPVPDKTPGKPAPAPTGVETPNRLLTGRITDAQGAGAGGLKVRVFENEAAREPLGEAETNADGVYRLAFTKKQIDRWGENYPRLHLTIEDAAGKRLFAGGRETRRAAGPVEELDVRLEEKPAKPRKPKRKP